MGCCVSVPTHQASTDKDQKPVFFTLENRAPPSVEEETVKEVLSEIPKPRPVMPIEDVKKQVGETKDSTKKAFKKVEESKQDLRDAAEKVQEESVKKRRDLESNEEEMSEVSEICSLTLSESVSTTTVKSAADDGGEVRQQRRQRMSGSPAKLPTRNRVVSQSPSRTLEQSPGKRSLNNGSVRLVNPGQKEESTRVRRVGSNPDRRRRDPGESSGRRSRSPAAITTRSGTVNRSPSRRTTTESPGRVRTDPNERGRRRLEGKMGINKNENKNSSSTNESLENPLVSLECFIFL